MAKEYWPNKDPDEVLDYSIDWSARLGADTISTSAWSVVSGTVVEGVNNKTDTVTTVWLSGGTVGENAEIHNRIVTAGGRTMDQTVYLRVRSK